MTSAAFNNIYFNLILVKQLFGLNRISHRGPGNKLNGNSHTPSPFQETRLRLSGYLQYLAICINARGCKQKQDCDFFHIALVLNN